MSKRVESSFERFQASAASEIQVISELLKSPLSDNPAILNEQVRHVEAWYGRLTTLLAHANAYLDLGARAELPERDEHRTDLDRKVDLDAAVALERRLRDELQGLTRAVEMRVSLTQSIMRSHPAEGRMGT